MVAQVRDSYGNASTASEGALTVQHIRPGEEGPGNELDAPKLKGGYGSYEIVVEPTRAGMHNVHVRLHGVDISGSPVSFNVTPV